MAELVEEHGNSALKLFTERNGEFPHLRVSRLGRALMEEVPPLTEISRHDNLRFKAIRKNRTGLLRRTPDVQHTEVGFLRITHSGFPCRPRIRTLFEETRLNHRDFGAELITRIIAVTSRLLTERRDSVPYQFVAHTAVTNEPHRKTEVLDYRLMPRVDTLLNELFARAIGNATLGLIADASAKFDKLYNVFTRGQGGS